MHSLLAAIDKPFIPGWDTPGGLGLRPFVGELWIIATIVTVLLGATLGVMLMASTTNLLMLFMAVEMASLPSYVLAGFRKTHRVGAEASLKYVLFGAATSAVMAYGLSLLYGLYGTLNIEQLAGHLAPGGSSALLYVAILGLIVGIG